MLMRARKPQFAVAAAQRIWIRAAGIELNDFEPGPYRSLEELFLRRLRPGARPLQPGFVSPVDGMLVAAGRLDSAGTRLRVKGRPISLDRLVNGRSLHMLPLDAYAGGSYAVIFLSPRGYHRIHMPTDGEIIDVRWLPGRYFPQNDVALDHIDAVYEKNERVVLQFSEQVLLILVGASLVGGIHLEAAPHSEWRCRAPLRLGHRVARGAEIAHFSFGSTVVVVQPAIAQGHVVPQVGDELRMGETLFAPP